MRNCLLTMLGEIIVQVLCKENMTDELRETRDEILDNLEVGFYFVLLPSL